MKTVETTKPIKFHSFHCILQILVFSSQSKCAWHTHKCEYYISLSAEKQCYDYSTFLLFLLLLCLSSYFVWLQFPLFGTFAELCRAFLRANKWDDWMHIMLNRIHIYSYGRKAACVCGCSSKSCMPKETYASREREKGGE